MPLEYKSYVQNAGGYSGGIGIKESGISGKKIFKLSSNENLFGPSPKIVQAIEGALANLHYYPEGNAYRVQKALSDYYHGALSAEQFVVTNGGSELIDLIVRGFLGPGTECVVSNPCFMPYIMFSNWVGARVIDVPMMPDYMNLDIERILAAINPKTKILFLCSPNNPSGSYIPKSVLSSLLDEVPSHVLVVFDEVYWHFSDAKDYTTALPLLDKHPNLIAINSLSKSFGLAALRIGYGYASEELAAYIRKLCKPFLLNQLNIEAALAALSDLGHLNYSVNEIIKERARVAQTFRSLGIHFIPSQANFHLVKPNMSEQEFTSALSERGIMVRPCSGFGAPGWVRITVGTKEANDALLFALGEIY